jgi:hypothetical protein
MGAALGLARLPPGARPLDDVLERIAADQGAHLSRELAKVLAAWNDPAARQRLQDLALGRSLGEHARNGAFEALARSCPDAAAVQAHVALFRSTNDPAVRAAIAGSLSSLTLPHHRDAFPAVLEIVGAALADPDWSVRMRAVSQIGDTDRFHTASILAGLESMLAAASEDRRTAITRAASKVRRTLRLKP